MAKKLEQDSEYDKLDFDGDGVVSDAEIAQHERIHQIENNDKKEDQIRAMAWFSLWGLLLYPIGITVTSAAGLTTAANLLSEIAPTYYVATSSLTAAFFASQAYAKTKS